MPSASADARKAAADTRKAGAEEIIAQDGEEFRGQSQGRGRGHGRRRTAIKEQQVIVERERAKQAQRLNQAQALELGAAGTTSECGNCIRHAKIGGPFALYLACRAALVSHRRLQRIRHAATIESKNAPGDL